jgi:hypothetical protein
MLVGSADPERFAKVAPTLARFDAPELVLADCVFVQALCEIDSGAMCSMLPPALHPTLPPVVGFRAFEVADSEWGPFRLAEVRIECRSGLRPRGLLVGAVIDSEPARRALADRFAFRARPGEVEIARAYDATRLRVGSGSSSWLDLILRKPERLGESDTQFVSSLHPAHTPRGFRLVQVDVEHAVRRAERGRLEIVSFDAAAWGEPSIEPRWPLPGVVGRADVAIRPIRFVCRADVLAFQGTESVAEG